MLGRHWAPAMAGALCFCMVRLRKKLNALHVASPLTINNFLSAAAHAQFACLHVKGKIDHDPLLIKTLIGVCAIISSAMNHCRL